MKRGKVVLETVHGNRMRRFVYASDYEFLERRYHEAVELLRKVEETMRLGCHHDLVQNNVELINTFLAEEEK